MNLADLLPIILAALFGGASGGGLLAVWLKLKEQRNAREESEIDRLRADFQTLREQHTTCHSKLDEVEQRLADVEHHHASYLPRWLKDAAKRVTWVNDKAMLAIFTPLGLDRDQVLGRTFEELLDPSAAAEIEALNARALAVPGAPASNLISLHPMLPVYVVVKVVALGREGKLVFEGYAYRPNDPAAVAGQGFTRQMRAIESAAEHILDNKDHEQ